MIVCANYGHETQRYVLFSVGFSQHWTSTAQKNEINQTSRRKKYLFSGTLFCCQTTCANVSSELLQTPVCRARQTCEGSRFNTNNALIPHVQCTAVQILVIYKSAVINVWQIRINLSVKVHSNKTYTNISIIYYTPSPLNPLSCLNHHFGN